MNVALPRALSGAALPPGLRDLPEPPATVFVHGTVPRAPCIAIVGTRHPTSKARAFALKLAARLAERGVAIVSGGAEGIDAAAHEGALEVGGITMVVGPSSFDRPFPAEHRELFARVVQQGGAYLSAYEANVRARHHQFLLRNSYLVALSQALIVVEAPFKSGARNAAHWAREIGRTCFVVPAVPWNPKGRGCILELQLGARALGSPEEVLRWLDQRQLHAVATQEPHTAGSVAPPLAARATSVKASRRPSRSHPKPELGTLHDPVLDAIVAALRGGCRHADEIGRAAALGAAAVSHGLLLLTLQGLVVQSPDGNVRLAD